MKWQRLKQVIGVTRAPARWASCRAWGPPRPVTVMNFQPTADDKAAITGDFVLVDREVNPVAKTLRQHGIDVTAIHNHGLLDTPRLFYMHFWANGDPGRLALGLKAALDHTNSARAPSPR